MDNLIKKINNIHNKIYQDKLNTMKNMNNYDKLMFNLSIIENKINSARYDLELKGYVFSVVEKGMECLIYFYTKENAPKSKNNSSKACEIKKFRLSDKLSNEQYKANLITDFSKSL